MLLRHLALLAALLFPLLPTTALAEPAAKADTEEAAATDMETTAETESDDSAGEAVTATEETDTAVGADEESDADDSTTVETIEESATTEADDSDDAEVVEEETTEVEETVPADPDNPGLGDLDQATQLKVTAEGLSDLNDVIDKLDSAAEKGLNKDNQAFADQLMIATLLQRAQLLSAAILDRPVQDPRWMQVRQFALTDLQRALEVDPDLPEANLLIGRLQLMPLGDPNAARRALTKAVDSGVATTEQKAQALAMRGALQKEEARQAADFDRAVELEPAKPDYYRVRAQYRYSKEKFADALSDADKALELAPDDPGTLELRGMILLGLDRLDDALASFNKAGELAPEAVLPYQRRGEVYRRQGDLNKAVEQLTKALELAPNDAGTLILRGTVYYQLNDMERALADIEAALAKQPQVLMSHLLRAEILASTGRVNEAVESLEKLVPLAPEQARLLDPLGRFYLIAGKPRKCIETFSKVIELEPENYIAFRFRGDAYLNIGKHKEAVADFDRAVALSEEDDGLLNNFAWVLATSPVDEVRDGKRAIELAKKAADLTSYNTPHILSTLAAAYAETGNFDEAKKWSQKSIEVCQAELDAATTDEQKKRLEADLGNLKNELKNFEEGKPVREQQSQEDSEAAPKAAPEPQAGANTFAPSSAVQAPARTLDF